MKTVIHEGQECFRARDIHGYLGIRSQYADWVRRRDILMKHPLIDGDAFDAYVPVGDAVEYMVQEPGDIAKDIRIMLVRGKTVVEIVEEIVKKEDQ